jgi:hypothetical protein
MLGISPPGKRRKEARSAPGLVLKIGRIAAILLILIGASGFDPNLHIPTMSELTPTGLLSMGTLFLAVRCGINRTADRLLFVRVIDSLLIAAGVTALLGLPRGKHASGRKGIGWFATFLNIIAALLGICMMAGSPVPGYLPAMGPWTVLGLFVLTCGGIVAWALGASVLFRQSGTPVSNASGGRGSNPAPD